MFSNSQESAENKLILLFIFNQFSIPLTNIQITEFVLEKDYMNYFILQQSLGELVSSGMLEYSESNDLFFYLLTEKGKNTLQYFISRLPDSLTSSIEKAVAFKKQMILREMQVLADYSKKDEHDYRVSLQVIENNIHLIDLKISVVSNKHAKQICDKWKNEAPKLYGDIIHLLIQQ